MQIRTQKHQKHRLSLLLLATLAFGACDSLLEVSNPNSIAGDDILKPEAAPGLVNGALALVSSGYSDILASYGTLTDELEWVGSRDAFQTLDFGDMEDPFNEFTDAEFVNVAVGRWAADEAVRVLTLHETNGELEDANDLARAHLYRAISYIQIADMYDDFAFSDRAESGAVLGEANMGNLYQEAINSLGTAISTGNAATVLAATALRARAAHALSVWGMIGQRPVSIANNGLVSNANAAADAAQALVLAGDPDWRWEFTYAASTVNNSMAGWVNQRQEMRIGPAYATPDPDAPTYTAVALTDLIDVATVSPELERVITTFSDGGDYSALTIVSSREMNLILAEDALANGNNGNFTTYINAVRTLDNLTDYSGQVDARDLLIHHRRTDMYLQGRRLADHYRFETPSVEWQASSAAVQRPGTFFPIAIVECRANTTIPDTC